MTTTRFISDLVTRPISDQAFAPLDRAKKQVERIVQIDSIKHKFPLDDYKLEIVEIKYLERRKKYDTNFSLYKLYLEATDEYERLSRNETTGYQTVCYNVSAILRRFYIDYCTDTDIGKKYRLNAICKIQSNITAKAKEIIKLLEKEYAKMELLVSKYSKVEAFDNICELTRVASALVKYGSLERLMAELCYSDDLSLFKRIVCTGILLSYSQADMFGADLTDACETSYKFLKTKFNSDNHYDSDYDDYNLLTFLIDNAAYVHYYEKKFFLIVSDINEQNHKFIENYSKERDQSISNERNQSLSNPDSTSDIDIINQEMKLLSLYDVVKVEDTFKPKLIKHNTSNL